MVGRAVTRLSRMRNLRFKSKVGQIGHSDANGSQPLQNFFEAVRTQWREDVPHKLATRFGIIQGV